MNLCVIFLEVECFPFKMYVSIALCTNTVLFIG